MMKEVWLPNPANLSFVEDLYDQYVSDPTSVPSEWRAYFQALNGTGDKASRPRSVRRPTPLFDPTRGHRSGASENAGQVGTDVSRQDAVTKLIETYRMRGHLAAAIDPLGRPRSDHPQLDPVHYGLSEGDLDQRFYIDGIGGRSSSTLGEVLGHLRETYCCSIGVQFMHLDDANRRNWLLDRMERTQNHVTLTREEQVRILTRLTDAVIFEAFIQQKYPGSKSFSLEGGESLIPLLDLAIETAARQGVKEIVLAMAHRGRLNVLANIVGKRPREIFREFEDPIDPLHEGRGDVKYHLGHSTDWVTASGQTVHLSLCFNPSHLEFVNPVALGRVRAKQDRAGDHDRLRTMALLIHGDASFPGEGIVQEVLNLSELKAYRTGGTVHVVINNQIGFTTCPDEARSSCYATDIALMLQIPIFHVNGEDAEAVAQVVRLALDYRRAFCTDVVIDMYCFRRRGHNEGDEPSFTQPLMYHLIEQRGSLREHYLERVLRLENIDRAEADRIAAERRQRLEHELAEARSHTYVPVRQKPAGNWSGYYGGAGGDAEEVQTGVQRARLTAVLDALTSVPDGFHLHPKIGQGLKRRREMAAGRPLDWSAAEALAFATIASDGHRIRLTGQDTARGTFSQRHAVLHDVEDGRTYMPLNHVAPGQAAIEIYNSPLSEAGVLGFEYGYSLDCPDGLILWEAQFGDFVNAAQVIIDQFLVSAEEKWHRLSGLVLLLPHGFEGQGPEHSSARLERFLELAVNDNIQIVNPTTPAQYFHLLRRQVLRRWRKPLIVMTPKSLLRRPEAVSRLEDLEMGRFRQIVFDRQAAADRVSRILLCSGRIYYDLVAMREDLKRDDVAIVRLEQLYPLQEEELQAAMGAYPPSAGVVWVQDEPANMGAWRYLFARFGDRMFSTRPFSAVCRPASASPATGWGMLHRQEQADLLRAAFDVH